MECGYPLESQREGQRSIVPPPATSCLRRRCRVSEQRMSQEEPYGPLRRDVRMLGSLLGRVLVEQEGAEFLAAEERIRASARLSREIGDPAPVREALGELPPQEQSGMLRAFALYFQLANTAEQHHRIRRRRAYATEDRAPRESLAEAFERLATVPETELRQRLADVSLQLVLTAHPTEATRRTLLRAHVRIAELLTRQDDPDLTTAERAELEDELTEEITILWQTDEVRADRPRVGDEIRHGLWFFEESLFDAGERLLREYRRLAPGTRPPFSFGSWIGGDTDGNPEVNALTIAAALERARESALSRYRADVRALSIAVSSSGSLVGVSAELADSLGPRCPGVPRIPRRRRPDDGERALPAEALVHVVAPRERRLLRPGRAPRGHRDRQAQPRGEPRRADRGRGDRRARPAGRALRLPPGEARRAAPRKRGAESDGAHARGVRRRFGRPRAPRRAGARHRDRLRDRDARQTSSACST